MQQWKIWFISARNLLCLKTVCFFVSGDLEERTALKSVKKIFGTWKKSNTDKDWDSYSRLNNFPEQTEYYYVINPGVNDELVNIYTIFNTTTDEPERIKENYVQDFMELLFYQQKDNKNFVPERSMSYYRLKEYKYDFDIFSISYYVNKLKINHVNEFYSKILYNGLFSSYCYDDSYYSNENKKSLKEFAEKRMTYESRKNLFLGLASDFAVYRQDYNKNYSSNINEVSFDDVKNYVNKYYKGNRKPVMLIELSPKAYSVFKDELGKSVYKEISFNDENSVIESHKKTNVTVSDYVPEEVFKPEYNNNVAKKTAAPKIKKYELKNGIPVYYINDKDSYNIISLYIDGGLKNLSADEAGLQVILLKMMELNSVNYDFFTRRKMYKEKKIEVNTKNNDLYDLFMVLYPADEETEAVNLFCDSICKTRSNSEDFDFAAKSMYEEYLSCDSFTNFFYEAQLKLYEGTGLNLPFDITSTDNLKIHAYDTIEYRNKFVRPGNIMVLISGEVNMNKVLPLLNDSLDLFKKPYVKKNSHEVSEIKLDENKYYIKKDSSMNGGGHILNLYKLPSRGEQDYYASEMCAKIYAEIIFKVVRTKYSACYSPEVYNFNKNFCNYGCELLYSVTDFENIMSYIDEAKETMLASDSIENKLNAVKKALYNNSNCSNLTSYGQVTGMIDNYLEKGSVYYSEDIYDEIMSVTAEDVRHAFVKYFVDAPCYSFAIVGEDVEFEFVGE